MKSQALANIGLAVALLGTFPSLEGGYRILASLGVLALVLSGVILLLRGQLRTPFWKRLVDISASIRTTYTAFGFGVCVSGISLLRPGWLSVGIVFLLAGLLLIGAGIGQNLLLLRTFILRLRRSGVTRCDTSQIAGAWQRCSFAGLEVVAYTTGRRGLYFTDETIQVTLELTNTINKRLRGGATFFYGFGPSGLEGRTSERISFDLEPKGRQGDKGTFTALHRLLGVQGNGIIGWSLQAAEQGAIEAETDEQRIVRPADESSLQFHTLYAFVSYNREFYDRVYVRQERLMKFTVRLTILVVFFALMTVIVGIIQILQSLGVLSG